MNIGKTIFGLICGIGLIAQAQAQEAASGKTNVSSPYKGEFVLVHNEDPVCVNFTRNLNEFRRMDFDVCHPRLSPKYPEFSRPQWREVPLDLVIASKILAGSANDWIKIDIRETDTSKQWLAETETLRQQGQLKMWMTDVDVNHDGEMDAIARVDRASPDRVEAVADRNCPYNSSGLWFFGEPKVPLYVGKHFYFGGKTDLIHSSATNRTYAVAWTEMAMSEFAHKFPSPSGATRGVSVGLARSGESPDPIEVCYMAWVPTGASTQLNPNQRWKRQR